MITRKFSFLIAALAVLFFLVGVSPAAAQKRKLPDKAIVGTWLMVSMEYTGESWKKVCGDDYSQIKYYGPTGEYACAEILKRGNNYYIYPHEYGTYTYNNGHYTEMGRQGVFIIKGNTARGRWYNRVDVWKKVRIPEELRKDVVWRCKANAKPSARIQKMIHQYILNKK